MRRRLAVTTIALGAAVTATKVEARLDLYVDKAAQQISVIQNGRLLYVWPVSTGRDRFSTPSGVYTPERLEPSWFSKAYYNSPMPHAIFFHNGYAIHGSYDISKLGGPASHGCVRLHPGNAALLFSMVQQEGLGKTAIFIGGDSNRPPLRYDDPARPADRGDDGIGRGAYPPEPVTPPGAGGGRYVDGAGAYPPEPQQLPDPRMSPYYPDRYADGRGAYPAGPDVRPYDDTDAYANGRAAPRGPRVATGGDADPYASGRRDPRGLDVSPEYNVDPYADGRGAAPHAPRAPSEYAVDPYADSAGTRRGPRLPPEYNADRYTGARGVPHDPRVPPAYNADRYVDAQGVPYDPRVPPEYNVDRYVDARGVPHDPRVPPEYAANPYVGARSAPRSAPPYYPEDRRDGPGAGPHGPRLPPYSSADPHGDGPGRRTGNQLATRGNAPANHLPALRPDRGAAVERAPRTGFQPAPAGAKANPTLPNPTSSNPTLPKASRLADEPPGRHVTMGRPARAPVLPAPAPPAPPPLPAASTPVPAAVALPPPAPPARLDPPRERTQPDMGYRVLPKSYWAGASWRWRMKRDEDGIPRDPH